MSIAEKKAEILHLIERLRTEQQRGKPHRRGPPPFSGQLLSERIATRRQDLLSLRDRRDRAGLDLLQERLLGICRKLDERIARIEGILEGGADRGAPISRGRNFAGTDLAVKTPSMVPDLDTDDSLDVTAAMRRRARSVHHPSSAADERLHCLSGALEEDTITDILQYVSSSDKTGIFAVEFGEGRIDLFFYEGQIVHALGGGLSGQQAFFAAMAVREGRFHFDETIEIPEERTIDGNTQFMILEALRQIDEERKK